MASRDLERNLSQVESKVRRTQGFRREAALEDDNRRLKKLLAEAMLELDPKPTAFCACRQPGVNAMLLQHPKWKFRLGPS